MKSAWLISCERVALPGKTQHNQKLAERLSCKLMTINQRDLFAMYRRQLSCTVLKEPFHDMRSTDIARKYGSREEYQSDEKEL